MDGVGVNWRHGNELEGYCSNSRWEITVLELGQSVD